MLDRFLYDIRLKRINLENFRPFSTLEIDFEEKDEKENIIVIIGDNGAGKTTILDSIAYFLSFIVRKAFSFNDNQIPIAKDVKNDIAASLIKGVFSLTYPFKTYEADEDEEDDQDEWENRPKECELNFSINAITGEVEVAKQDGIFPYKEAFEETFTSVDSYPVLAYYGNKIDVTIPSETATSQSWDIKSSIYKNALTPNRFSFKSFYEWFDRLYKSESAKKETVTNAILQALNEKENQIYSNLRMKYLEGSEAMVIDKNGSTVEVSQMSAGEKGFIALVGDLSKRLILANPSLENPLEGTGIVLIDEIDLHLHPKWQRRIIVELRELFPNIQFIITTHSPFVLQSVKANQRKIIGKEGLETLKRDTELTYEAIVNDYFSVNELFDIESEELLNKFEIFKIKILKKEISIQDENFLVFLKEVLSKGNAVKGVIARELRYIKSQI